MAFIFKHSSQQTLVNYWPMSNLSDIVGGATLYNGISWSYTSDRFGDLNQAVYFNNGYLQAPPGIYFSGDLTVIVWAKWIVFQNYSAIIDFGNGAPSNNVVMELDSSGNSFEFESDDTMGTSSNIFQSVSLSLNQWYHMAMVLSGTTGYLYVNGVQVSTGILNLVKNVTRLNNYVGKSNWASVANTNAVYDDLKIYRGAMTASAVLADYASSCCSK